MSTTDGTPEGQGKGSEWPSWLQTSLDDLDGQVVEMTDNPSFNAHVSMFNMLPEHSMGNTIGSTIEIEFDTDDEDLRVCPIAMYGGGILARDLRVPVKQQDAPNYLFIRGSVFVAPEQVEERGIDLITKALAATISRGIPMKAAFSDGLNVIYNPATFCRDARLAYTTAFSLEELTQQHMKTRTARLPIVGSVITVPLQTGKTKVVFLEEPFQLSEPIRNVWQFVDDEDIPLLDHVDEF